MEVGQLSTSYNGHLCNCLYRSTEARSSSRMEIATHGEQNNVDEENKQNILLYNVKLKE